MMCLGLLAQQGHRQYNVHLASAESSAAHCCVENVQAVQKEV